MCVHSESDPDELDSDLRDAIYAHVFFRADNSKSPHSQGKHNILKLKSLYF